MSCSIFWLICAHIEKLPETINNSDDDDDVNDDNFATDFISAQEVYVHVVYSKQTLWHNIAARHTNKCCST